jgi:carbohydrate-selective porin OprB
MMKSHGFGYQRTLASPLIIAQAETSRKFLGGLTGNYRAYAWQRSRGNEIDGSTAHHAGWGLSADQKVGDGLTLFGRYGQQLSGKVRFDRALTLGSEINGSYWSRGGDSLGVAAGLLHASSAYHDAGLRALDVNGDGVTDYSYTPGGSEKLAEIYYRYRITKQFELSPNFQYISKLGGNADAASVKIVGLRAQLAF